MAVNMQTYREVCKRSLTAKNEKADNQMRQSTAETVSHLVKSAETEKGQIHAQITDNLLTNPIQERSKDGIGIRDNINEKNVSQNTQIPNTPITLQQQQIILLLYRFRFLDRTQIQQYLNHKNHKRILV